jgi:hypothetical protein
MWSLMYLAQSLAASYLQDNADKHTLPLYLSVTHGTCAPSVRDMESTLHVMQYLQCDTYPVRLERRHVSHIRATCLFSPCPLRPVLFVRCARRCPQWVVSWDLR